MNSRSASLVAVLTALSFPLLSAAAPADDALAWLKSVDEQFKEPRLPGLTVEKLATLTEVKLGGHRKSDNKHIVIPAADFRHLAALPALRRATLWEIRGLDNEALAHIGKVTTLRELELGDAEISDAGLKHLRGLQSLTFLGLGWTKDVTDAGLMKLKDCKALTTVIVNKKTGTTPAGITAFTQQRPDCQVVVK